MYLKKKSLYLKLICFYIFISSIQIEIKAKTDTHQINFSTSFYFLYDHLRFLIHDHAQINLLTPKDQDPAHYTPNETEVKSYQESDLIFLNGAGFEGFEKKMMLPKSKIVYTSQSFKKDWLHAKTQSEHRHGRQGLHHHASTDPHTWVDPILAIEQIKNTYLKLKEFFKKKSNQSNELDPSTLQSIQNKLDQRFESLKLEFEEIDQQWQSLDFKGFLILSSHPSYAYLAKRYGFEIEAFDFEPDLAIEHPSQAQQMALVISFKQKILLSNPNQKLIFFWEKTPHPSLIKALEAQEIQSYLLRTVESEPTEGYYLRAVHADLKKLAQVFQK
jgi:ABC-type Zn uptake system ZnuABC Zn-binding protein ZnuA